jgi:hypothetical protein
MLPLVDSSRGQETTDEAPSAKHDIYFGWLVNSPEMAAVAFDIAPPDAEGNRDVRAYVCDGFGPPQGMAVWFRGPVPADDVKQLNQRAALVSASEKETLVIGDLNEIEVRGVFTRADGASFRYVAYPAFAGAGIYQVTLDEERRFHGTSTDGHLLEAQAQPDDPSLVLGTILSPDGETINFDVEVLALLPTAELAAHGNSSTYRDFADHALVPGEYVAVISPGASFWFGRNGNVRGGDPGGDIIGLDKSH